jgi:hypothetical protein
LNLKELPLLGIQLSSFFYEITLFTGVVDHHMKLLETIAGRNWGRIGVCKAQ